MQRYCVCGLRIAPSTPLCARCARQYGTKVEAWPEWLKFWVRDVDRERKRENRHQDLEFREEIDYEIYGSPKGKPTSTPDPTGFEIEQDEWGNEISWINGLQYVDVDKQRRAENEFQARLRSLEIMTRQRRNVND